ncbi:MAG: hypothetical protein PHH36_05570 [Sideroxydans sp.]|nr:hypothetical protein [Sideroxydans sp.]
MAGKLLNDLIEIPFLNLSRAFYLYLLPFTALFFPKISWQSDEKILVFLSGGELQLLHESGAKSLGYEILRCAAKRILAAH